MSTEPKSLSTRARIQPLFIIFTSLLGTVPLATAQESTPLEILEETPHTASFLDPQLQVPHDTGQGTPLWIEQLLKTFAAVPCNIDPGRCGSPQRPLRSSQRILDIFPIEHGDAKQLAVAIRDLTKQLHIYCDLVADVRTQKLIVTATDPDELELIKRMIHQLDRKSARPRRSRLSPRIPEGHELLSAPRPSLSLLQGKVKVLTLLNFIQADQGQWVIYPANEQAFGPDAVIEILDDIDRPTYEIIKILLEINGYDLVPMKLSDKTTVLRIQHTCY